MDDRKLLGRIPLQENNELRVHQGSGKWGRFWIDIRHYFKNENGDWYPTKKGIRIGEKNFEELIKILFTVK